MVWIYGRDEIAFDTTMNEQHKLTSFLCIHRKVHAMMNEQHRLLSSLYARRIVYATMNGHCKLLSLINLIN